MESLDFKSFFSSIEPFSTLKKDDLSRVLKAVDIEYYKANEPILKKDVNPESYYLVAKGYVKEVDEDEQTVHYGTKDSFDAEAIIEGRTKNSFYAGEETILFTLKKERFLELFHTNDDFKNYYLNSISDKFKQFMKKGSDTDLAIFISTRIKDSYIHPAVLIDKNRPILEGVTLMSQNKSDSLIVDFGNTYGIVTNTDLREKVILHEKDVDEPIGDIATQNLICIDEEKFLFNALLLMIENSIARVGVTRGSNIIGILEQIDLLSSMSGKAHLINLQIQRAKTVEELKAPSSDVIQTIKSLQHKGVKVRYITKLLTDINTKIYKKLFELIVPEEVRHNVALIVMGSEGRHEQTLRTDQDNALLLKDGFDHEGLHTLMQTFTDTLTDFGFPKCEGNIMVSNPDFCKSVTAYKKDIDTYVQQPTGEYLMRLAILYDASFIAGDKTLFETFKEHIFKSVKDDVGFFAHFAKAILIFDTPLSFFSGFVVDKKHENGIDIKKGAIFPIVHAMRSLSLEKGIHATNTIERIKQLSNIGYFDRSMAEELIEAFTFLLTLRLKIQLQQVEQKQALDNFINPQALSKFERDLLRDVFKLVDKLKKQIAYHFKLSMVS